MTDLINKYNAHGALKVPMSLWVFFGFGLRHVALILFPPTRIAFETYSELFIGKIFLIPDVLIGFVILVNMFRLPEASDNTRKIWKFSYWLVLGAFALDALLTLVTHTKAFTDPDHLHFNHVLANFLIDLGVIAILLSSQNIKAVFKSFPERPVLEEPMGISKAAPDQEQKIAVKTTSNIPDAALINASISLDFQLAGYPFTAGDRVDPLIRVRQHLTNNNLALAEKGLRYLLEQQPQNGLYWHELGLVAFAAEKLPQAEALILKAIIFEPNNYLYWRNLGEIRRRMGHIENAIEDAKKSISLKSDDVNAYYNLGLALWDSGRKEEALKAFEEAKIRHPNTQPIATS